MSPLPDGPEFDRDPLPFWVVLAALSFLGFVAGMFFEAGHMAGWW